MAVGTVTKQYVSSVDMLDQRELLHQALDITNEEYSFLDVMELTNRMAVTGEPTYHHSVNEELYELGVVSAVSGTTTLSLTLTAATAGSCKVGDVAMFPDGKQGWVKAKSAAASPVLTITSVDGTSLASSVSQGDNISFFTAAYAEGSGAPDPERWNLTWYGNQVQIYKAKFQITDIQKVSKIEVNYDGKPYFFYKGQHDVLKKFRANIGFSMLLSVASAANFGATTATITDANNKPVQTTKGLNQYVGDQGINETLDSTTIGLDDIMSLTRSLTLARCPQSYEVYMGIEFSMIWDNYFNALGNGATLSQAARYQINQNLDIGVKSINIYGRDYHKIYMPQLDHKNVMHYTGAPSYYKSAYFVPKDKIAVDNSGDKLDRIRVRYMDGDGTDLRYKEFVTGGLAPTPTSDDGNLAIAYESVMGLEILGAQHFAKWTPAETT